MPYGDVTSGEEERVARGVVHAAYLVHRHFGPGLLESIYERCLAYELQKMGFKVRRQVEVPVVYDGVELDEGLRIDLLVEEVVIVEVKASEKNHDLHKAQVLTYLKLTGLKLGLLINFNTVLIKEGLKRILN